MDTSLVLSTLSAARELAGLLIAERDRQKAAAIKIELTDKLTQAQLHVSQLLADLLDKHTLLSGALDRVRELEAHQREHARYQLARLSLDREVHAYRLRPAAELVERVDEPPHFLCQPCFDRNQKSVLVEQHVWGSRVWLCSLCRAEVTGDVAG